MRPSVNRELIMSEEKKISLQAVQSAVSKLSYGLYIVSSFDGERNNGQLVNTVFQVAAAPPGIAVSLNKNTLTHSLVEKSGLFSVSVLDRDTPMPFIGIFGFKSGHDGRKCEKIVFKTLGGCPAVAENSLAIFTVRVGKKVDMDTHTIFIGAVTAAETLKDGPPLTYAYYKDVKRGKTQKNATTYAAETGEENA